MKTDILIIHPYKHHAFHLAVGCKKSGRKFKAVFPFYEKGFAKFFKYIPGVIGKKASGYIHPELKSEEVISSFFWQIRKLFSYFGNPMDFQYSFDEYVSLKIKNGYWSANIIVLLQDHMPKTAFQAHKKGIVIWSDQINYSYEAIERFDLEWNRLGYSGKLRNEADNINILSIATYITAPSAYAYEKINSLARVAKKIKLIPYGVDNNFFYPSNFKNKDSITILVRANSIQKGGAFFLKALEKVGGNFVDLLQVSKVFVNILGNLDSFVLNVLKNSFFDSRVTISYGAIPQADVPGLMRAASIFVMPSLSESMSLACVEAMQCGLPLLVTKYVGVDCFVDGEMGLYVEPTIDSVANGLIKIANNKINWNQWGVNASNAAKELSWDIYEESIARYASLL